MTFNEVMGYYRHKRINIARALKISRQAIHVWEKNNKIPYPYQCILEVETKGELKAQKEEEKDNHE